MGLKRLGIIVFALLIGASPSFAFMNGKISKGHFYDSKSTIMSEIESDKTLTAGEYWAKNALRQGKYRPLFMLSNKELFNLMPKEHVSVSQRISTPSVYNISLKSASITNVSLKTHTSVSKPAQQASVPVTKPAQIESALVSQYQQAKAETLDMDKKLDVAVLLKNSKKPSNYTMAFNLLNEVIAKEPLNAYAYYLKAELFVQKNDAQNAIKNYAEALRINPMSKQSCLGLAKVLEPTNKTLAKKYYDLAKNEY